MQVGRAAQLFRYPVKSMRGEEPSEKCVDDRGGSGDRGWAADTPDGGIGSGKTTRRFRRIVARVHDMRFGRQASVLRPGRIRVGDAARLS